jgi:uncharacterized membrane protein YeaQ/YmgE (transglycosylase-associated protein family)
MLSRLISWIVVGLIAGWLAGKVMRGGGFGVFMDIVIGMLGAVIGGWVFRLLGIFPGGDLIGSVLVAFVGAVILLWLVRMIKKGIIYLTPSTATVTISLRGCKQAVNQWKLKRHAQNAQIRPA